MATATHQMIDEIERGLVAAETEAVEAFWQFAEQSARADRGEGDLPAAHEVNATLRAMGKNTQDFLKAVEIKRRRLRLRETADGLAAANEALRAAETAQEEHKQAALARAEADRRLAAEHAEKVARARNAANTADSAVHELRVGSAEVRPWLHEKVKAGKPHPLGRLSMEIRARLDSLPTMIENRKREIAEREQSPWRFARSGKITELKAEIEQLEREQKLLVAKLAACQASVASGQVPDEVALQP